MPTAPLPNDLAIEALQTLQQAGGNYSEAARRLNIPLQTFRDRIAKGRERKLDWYSRRSAYRGEVGGPEIPKIAIPPEGFGIIKNSGEYDKDGNLRKQWVQTTRESGDIYEIPVGHTVKGESTLVDPQGQILAKWIKTRESSTVNLIDALKETFEKYSGLAVKSETPTHCDEDILTVYPLPDLHLGMYAWGRETGGNYDTNIAVELASSRIAALIEQAEPSKQCVILGLGDYFHANDTKGVTPGSGNKLDVDGRWAKVFLAGAKLATRIIDLASQKHEQVEVVFLPGNHDPDASIALTVAVSMFYSKISNVRVFQEPTIAWYRRFGKVLLGATHGHTMKPETMAMMLATDRAADWGETEFRHFFFGHVHHKSMVEIGPVVVESLSSPASRDAWNAASGYRSSRGLTSVTFHCNYGEIGRRRVHILPTKE